MHRMLRWSLAGLIVATAALVAPAIATAASNARGVTTEPIILPPAEAGDNGSVVPPDAPPDEDAAPADDTAAPATPEEVPAVEYDFTKLPKPVERLREQIIAAATTGDPEKLRAIIDAQETPPDFGPSDTGDLIGYLKLQSGDAEGREILAILIEVLEAGYVHVDVGTPDEVYLWPYFARYPIDKLSGPQLVQLFKLVYAGDYQDMLANGVYDYFRAGIGPDGTWKFFTAGD